MSPSQQLPADHPESVKWEEFKKSDEFAVILGWLAKGHYTGELWQAFDAGWQACMEHVRGVAQNNGGAG